MRTHHAWSMAAILSCLMLIAACEAVTEVSAVDEVAPGIESAVSVQEAALAASVRRDLATVRAATARYHRVEVAEDDEYEKDPHCAEIPEGGMGHHYIKWELIGPPEALDVSSPQVLLYEPQKNGRMKLVAAEWIIPYDIVPSDAPAPEFMGQQFSRNPGLGLWMLHAWIWEHNPDGIFANWNPRVSCQYAAH